MFLSVSKLNACLLHRRLYTCFFAFRRVQAQCHSQHCNSIQQHPRVPSLGLLCWFPAVKPIPSTCIPLRKGNIFDGSSHWHHTNWNTKPILKWWGIEIVKVSRGCFLLNVRKKYFKNLISISNVYILHWMSLMQWNKHCLSNRIYTLVKCPGKTNPLSENHGVHLLC